jgi:hypothetical protein
MLFAILRSPCTPQALRAADAAHLQKYGCLLLSFGARLGVLDPVTSGARACLSECPSLAQESKPSSLPLL